jgi:hypothetical protein
MAFKAVAATILIAAAAPGAVQAAPSLSSFTVTPSTTKAGGHPSLVAAFAFAEPVTGVKQVALHLPAGLTVHPRAIPFCARLKLLQNLCLPRSKAGSLSVTAVAYGFELSVTRSIYNVRPLPGERVRMGVPIIGSYSHPGIAAEVPLVQRPTDGGLDLAVSGLPTEVAGVPVRFRDVKLRLRASGRVRVKSKLRTRPFLTNPRSCAPATSTLEIALHEPSAPPLTSTTSFTPTGC